MNQLIYSHSAGGGSAGICFGFNRIWLGFLHRSEITFCFQSSQFIRLLLVEVNMSLKKELKPFACVFTHHLQRSRHLSHSLPAAYFVFKVVFGSEM